MTLRHGSSKAWMNRHVKDAFVQRAVKENLRSRSAYKLEEMQEKHKLIRPGDVVVDLGAAPGGWSLVATRSLRPAQGGRLISLDLLPMEAVPNAHILQGDFTTQEVQSQLLSLVEGRKVDVVLSDMLGNATGHSSTDHFRSMDLVRSVIHFAQGVLSPSQGVVLCKYLRGEDEKALMEECKAVFKTVKVVKPAASRSESTEAYLLAKGLKLESTS